MQYTKVRLKGPDPQDKLRAGRSPQNMGRAASESVRVRGWATAHAHTDPPAYAAHTPGKTPNPEPAPRVKTHDTVLSINRDC